MNKIIVILGPTATGKTDVALKLARKYNGELVAADSRQVYRGLDIGTGKMPSGSEKWKVRSGKGSWEINRVKVWMYDVVNPDVQYSVADYVKDAEEVIEDIFKRGKVSIIVGGTGFYLKALLEGLSNLSVPVDKELREELEKLSLLELQEKLMSLSPIKWKNLNESDRKNPRRVLRSIELIKMNPYMGRISKYNKKIQRWDVLKIGLTAPREVLYKNVDQRVLSRFDQGMLKEAEDLHKNGLSTVRMKQLGLEYGVLADYLEGEIQSQNLILTMQNKIHGYIKRQLTWFKKEKNVNWFDITDKEFNTKVENLVAKWYDSAV